MPVQGCTLPYSRAIPLLPLWAVRSVQSLSACTRVRFTSTISLINWTLCPNAQEPFLWTNYDFYVNRLHATGTRHNVTGLMFQRNDINNCISASFLQFCELFLATRGYSRIINPGLCSERRLRPHSPPRPLGLALTFLFFFSFLS